MNVRRAEAVLSGDSNVGIVSWSDECPKFRTIEARKSKIKGSCYIRLRQGQKSSDVDWINRVYFGESFHLIQKWKCSVYRRNCCNWKLGSYSTRKCDENANFLKWYPDGK